METGAAVAAPAKKKRERGRHGLGHVYEHRANWWLDVRIRGKRHRMKLGAVKVLEKRDAYKIRDEKLKELLMPKAPVAKGQKSFSELAKEFVTHYTKVQPRKSWLKYTDKSPEQTPMQHCFRFFGDTPLRDITRSKVEDFMAHLRQRKVGKHRRRAWTVTTVTKNVSLLRAAFYWAIEKGYADTNPAAEQPMKENQGPERILEMEEEPKLFEQVPSWLRLMAIFCLQTATRRGDLLNLTWKAVHPETVEFLETKEIKKRINPSEP